MTSKRLLSITFMLLGFIVAVAVGAEQVSSTDSADTARSVQENLHELWRANVQALESEASDSQVDQVIQKIRAIQLPRREEASPQEPIPQEPPPPVPAPQVLAPVVDVAEQESKAESPVEKLLFGNITPQTLRRLKKAAPEAFADPVELADALFSNGNFKAAGYFYQVNLKRDLNAEDKAWTLLQIGNCLVKIDPAEAEKSYKSLLADFSDSPWVPLAKTKLKLMSWHKSNNPQAVLKSIEEVLKLPVNTQPLASSKSSDQQRALNQTESP